VAETGVDFAILCLGSFLSITYLGLFSSLVMSGGGKVYFFGIYSLMNSIKF